MPYHIKRCWVAPPPSPTGGIILGLINWTGQNNPRQTRRPPISLVHCTIMKDGKHQFLTHNSERLVIKPLNWKTFIQSSPKIFQSVVRNVEFLRDRFEGLDTASFSSLQKWPEYVRHFSKAVEIFLRKCWKNAHESLSPLTQEKRAVFSCVIRLFRNEKGILLKKKFDPRLLLGLLLGSCRSAIGNLSFCP